MVLKTLEGTAMGVFKMVKTALMSNLKSKLAAAMVKPELMGLKNRMDYSEYGGAGLFGLKAPVIKAHGSSDDNAIYNAIRQTRDMVGHDVIPVIAKTIENNNKS
jgi:glycerol-3-phosphate acyltransferase PlsX